MGTCLTRILTLFAPSKKANLNEKQWEELNAIENKQQQKQQETPQEVFSEKKQQEKLIEEKKSIEIQNKSQEQDNLYINVNQVDKEQVKRESIGVKKDSEENNLMKESGNSQKVPNSATQKKKPFAIEMNIGSEIFNPLKKGNIWEFYKKGSVLGEGAYGKVYQVEQKKTKFVRAMKMLKKRSLINEDEKQWFAELNILKGLDHPNIVKLHELFQDENNYYIVTEYCQGGELFERIKSMTNFSERLAAEYIKQILSAVAYCHEKSIVHRDLKPENLIFDKKGVNGILKVIDFGTSRKFDNKHKMTKRLGTPYYIAPEVLQQNYTEKCDVWSCGIILYILLCGYPPFTGRNEAEILQSVKKAKLEFDPDDWLKISDDAKNLIKKMLHINPDRRISAKEAYSDGWVARNASSNPLNTKCLENIRNFDAKNKLKTSIMAFIATQIMNSQEQSELRKAFSAMDKDGDGVLDKQEIVDGYFQFYGDRDMAEQIANQLLENVDYNMSGKIDYSEFMVAAMAKEKLLSTQKIEQAFALFDKDGDGFLDQSELNEIMGEIDEEKWQMILDEYDANQDGKVIIFIDSSFIKISKEEFIELLQKNVEEEKKK